MNDLLMEEFAVIAKLKGDNMSKEELRELGIYYCNKAFTLYRAQQETLQQLLIYQKKNMEYVQSDILLNWGNQ
ncbi:hypothetical protein [Scytonema sp. NUACC26]|uniref:hypothetical protein n=1 Tax=Scytonema sp. NUACC26 TaxID=3140176 RepID=UPI0034DBE938